MIDPKKLQPGALLTVKEAAKLTNLSVPTFYTAQRKRDFGFDPDSDGQWLISIDDLVAHGLLTQDFQPTRGARSLLTQETASTLEHLKTENEGLRKEIEDLKGQLAVLQVLVEQKNQQLEMVNSLISKMGK
jgi:hypothetical protein